jgi:hypothetical protein
MHKAHGTFEVKPTQEPPYDTSDGISLGRALVDKQFVGDLEATSQLQMLGARTKVAGSAGYVGIERVVGTLHGRSGSFVLQHSGQMKRGQSSLSVSVVADSGTGALSGLAGTMTIEVVNGQHRYSFDYTLDV